MQKLLENKIIILLLMLLLFGEKIRISVVQIIKNVNNLLIFNLITVTLLTAIFVSNFKIFGDNYMPFYNS